MPSENVCGKDILCLKKWCTIGSKMNVVSDLNIIMFAFLVSEQLSGTVSSSVQASRLVKIPVYTFDSQLLSYPMTYIMKKAMNLYNSGHSQQDILKKVAFLRDSNETYVLIGSLQQLYRSERLHSIKYYLGSLLKIKPIISLVKGKLTIQSVARNERYAEKIVFTRLKYTVEQYNISDCLLLYGQFYKQSEQWVHKIQQLYPDLILHVYPLGTVIGLHAGGNTLGISWFKEKI